LPLQIPASAGGATKGLGCGFVFGKLIDMVSDFEAGFARSRSSSPSVIDRRWAGRRSLRVPAGPLPKASRNDLHRSSLAMRASRIKTRCGLDGEVVANTDRPYRACLLYMK